MSFAAVSNGPRESNQRPRFRQRIVSLSALVAILALLLPAQPVPAAEVVATVAGSFQSEIGCPDDWQPGCDNSLMSDADGDGVYSFTSAPGALPVGEYEYKVALNRGWDASYPADNQAFRIASLDNGITFFYDPSSNEVSHVISGSTPPAIDGDIFWDGLGHDSRDQLYRLPGGAVVEDSTVTLRFRTFANDVTSVSLRAWHTGLSSESISEMQKVASDVDCYDTSLTYGCDFWETTIDVQSLGIVYYRFIVRDGSKTVFYEDDSEVRDGGWGQAFDQSPDWGWVLAVYDKDFQAPISWMQDAVVYQIFPDRFRNGDPSNDPTPLPENDRLSSDFRYAYPNGDPGGAYEPEWEQIVRMQWGELPEGYCRNYVNVECEAREFFEEPPYRTREWPNGRSYYGGDLDGVTEKLTYLKQLGVTVIYFNPIFAAGSTHRYDTRDYRIIDPYLGDLGTWQELEQAAEKQGIRIILDGVFNHMSADSPMFDRYGNWDDEIYGTGACESESSPYRQYFRFRTPNTAAGEVAACAPYTTDGPSYYESWAGFDSIPALSEDADVKEMIYGADDSVARYWLEQGADGWRLDVMPDKSHEFWREFREVVKSTDPDSIIVGELWQKSVVLPYVNGDTADTTMNYRLRDAVIGLLAPGSFDAKGFAGSGEPIVPSEFVDRMLSIREDYPDAFYYSLMNLLDSHDTERVLWTLTPGAENREEREFDEANLAEGKARQRLAVLIQMTMPGAPTIYYGDEVGLTGDDDPDDRRTYPWGDNDTRKQGDTREPDARMLRYYQQLTKQRGKSDVLVSGDLQFLLADDNAGAVAYGRTLDNDASVVVLNTSKQQQTIAVPMSGYLPDGTKLVAVVGELKGDYIVQDGQLTITVPALGGALLETRDADLTSTDAPDGLSATVDGVTVSLTWNAVSDANGYNVYRSPVSGGGYVKLNDAPLTGASFVDTDADLNSGQRYYYVVRALDNSGNESDASNEATAVPSYQIGWANLQWPPTLDYTVSASTTTDSVYGQLWIDGVTGQAGPTSGLIAQLGYGEQGSDPRGWTTWSNMEFNTDAGNNDEYRGVMQPATPGSYSYFTRYSTDDGTTWTYGDLDGIEGGSFGEQTDQPGAMTVRPSADTEPPAAPADLEALNNGPSSISLAWTASISDDVFRYDVYRSTTSGSGYTLVESVNAPATEFVDDGLQTGTTYFYVVRAVDEANNVSEDSNEASATPAARDVAVTFEVSVPASTPDDGTVFIVGGHDEICNWCNPHTVGLTEGTDGTWRITLTLQEGTLVEYKYTLGSWDFVEKDSSCGEIGNRQLRVISGPAGAQLVQDTVEQWRNVAPCGN